MVILQKQAVIQPLFKPQYAIQECLDGLREVLESGWTGYGPTSFRFEKEWSSYVNAPHSLFLNSGTSALHIALRLADLPSRSHVLSSPLTFLAPNAVILHEGHIPVFVDINPDNLAMDEKDCLNKWDRYSAKAAIWIHYGGFVAPQFYSAVDNLKEKKVALIEDCAHAAGACYRDGTKVGSQGFSTACFSYGAVKNLPTFEAGMLCIASELAFQRARRLSYFGIQRDVHKRLTNAPICRWNYDVPELGWKYNGNDVAAAIGLVQLKYLDWENKRRAEIYHRYLKNLAQNLKIRFVMHSSHSSHYAVMIQVRNRKEVIQALQNNHISCGLHDSISMTQSVFSPFYQSGECPVFERVCEEMLSLPNHLLLQDEEIDSICEVIDRAAQ